MGQQHRANGAVSRAAQLLGLLLLAALGMFLALGPVRAQETSEPTNTPEPDTNTVVRLAVEEPVEPLPAGQEFPVDVLVDSVEHVAGFDFTITFDPDKLEFVRAEGQGEFLNTGERPDIRCPDLTVGEGSLSVLCNTFGPPLCLGGGVGASGSGLLATVVFLARGKGDATIELSDSTLALDDLEPCDPESPVISIPHRREGALTVPMEGGGGGFSTGLLIGIIAGAAIGAVVVVGGGLLWYRRRQAGS